MQTFLQSASVMKWKCEHCVPHVNNEHTFPLHKVCMRILRTTNLMKLFSLYVRMADRPLRNVMRKRASYIDKMSLPQEQSSEHHPDERLQSSSVPPINERALLAFVEQGLCSFSTAWTPWGQITLCCLMHSHSLSPEHSATQSRQIWDVRYTGVCYCTLLTREKKLFPLYEKV